jgi:hypothetical protein
MASLKRVLAMRNGVLLIEHRLTSKDGTVAATAWTLISPRLGPMPMSGPQQSYPSEAAGRRALDEEAARCA